ncbi:MAG: cation-translocating P-type ATPase [Candidatus Babeliales bacterium]
MNVQDAVFSPFTNQSADAVVAQLKSDSTSGLTQQQAMDRQKEYGLNKITGEQTHWYNRIAHQIKSPFIYLLLAVACISFFFENHLEGAVVLLIVFVNTAVGFWQEYRADKALQFLKKYLVNYVTVIRNGTEGKIPQEELVPGDIVLMYPGDIIPADMRIIRAQNLKIDESLLTGESIPVVKQVDALAQATTQLFEATNIVFSGTTVISGKGVGVIIATGTRGALGAIASLTVTTERVSSFSLFIGKFSRFILRMMLISIIIIFTVNLIVKDGKVDLVELVLFSAALAVSVIPEALPIVTTFALSQGALRLARHKTVVKRLSAIEDLGNIEILCADKTGTLTENKLSVRNVYGSDSQHTIVYENLSGSFTGKNVASLKGFDIALYQALDTQTKKQLESYERIAEFPFDPIKRSDAVLVKKQDAHELVIRGAAEFLIERCVLSTDEKKAIRAWLEQEGNKGHRILAVAKKEVTAPRAADYEGLEKVDECTFIGAVAFEDPLKATAVHAIEKAQRYNIECKIISGDAKEVCSAVACQIGLICDPKAVVIGSEFAKMSEAEKKAAVKKHKVFARISPQQKFEIIHLLQEYKEVGYLGDGMNDAPALKEARVALAVHDSADIAREAADIILLEKSLMVVVNGIVEGRTIFANTLKYIRATLSSTFGNFYTLSVASMLLEQLPLLPVQILLLNFMSDFPMISVATDNVAPEELKRAGQYDAKEIALLATILGVVSSLFDFVYFSIFVKLSAAELQTGWFVENILTQMAFICSIRTSRSVFTSVGPSWLLACMIALTAAVGVLLPYTNLGQGAFFFVPITLMQLLKIVIITFAYFIASDVIKTIYFKLYEGKNSKVRVGCEKA